MNIRLSISTVRNKGKHGFVIEKQGKTIQYSVNKITSRNIKEDILSVVSTGLRACRRVVSHEDILVVEIQNMHLQQWLSGMIEYKDYAEALDEVFEVLETLNCRYKFVYVKEPYAKKVVTSSEIDKIAGDSLNDIMSEFEGK